MSDSKIKSGGIELTIETLEKWCLGNRDAAQKLHDALKRTAPHPEPERRPIIQPDECRHDFEKWAAHNYISTYKDHQGNFGQGVQICWEAFQAGWNSRPMREIFAECKAGISVVKPEYAARGRAESTTAIEGQS